MSASSRHFPVASSAAVARDPPDTKKRKRHTNSNALGNKFRFPEVNRRDATEQDGSGVVSGATHLSDSTITTIVTSKCCEMTECILNHFTTTVYGKMKVSFNEAIEFFRECREEKGFKAGKELDHFIQDKFRSSIDSQRETLTGKIIINMNYRLQGDRKVCKTAFAAALGFSVKRLEKCSMALKKSLHLRVTDLSLQSWKDDHIHGKTYTGVEEMFEKALGIDTAGKYYTAS